MEREIEISTDQARLDIDVIHRFLQTSYWAQGRRRSVWMSIHDPDSDKRAT